MTNNCFMKCEKAVTRSKNTFSFSLRGSKRHQIMIRFNMYRFSIWRFLLKKKHRPLPSIRNDDVTFRNTVNTTYCWGRSYVIKPCCWFRTTEYCRLMWKVPDHFNANFFFFFLRMLLLIFCSFLMYLIIYMILINVMWLFALLHESVVTIIIRYISSI